MTIRSLVLLFPLFFGPACGTRAQLGPARVVTQRAGNARTGATLDETSLTSAAVKQGFHKLFTRDVDGQFYAAPLYLRGVAGRDEVAIVATEHNTVYAFDVGDATAVEPLWSVNLGPSALAPNPDFGNRWGGFTVLGPEVGITSTPVVVDDVVFVDAFVSPEPHVYRHTLFALDVSTGSVLRSVDVAAQVAGDGAGAVDGVIAFDAQQHLQRCALMYEHGLVYLAFASYADTDPFHGWILAYDASTLEQRFAFCVTPDAAPADGENAGEGGIWQASAGPAADDEGNVFVATGNGSFNAADGGRNYGDSLLKLAPGSATVLDWFTPHDQAGLAAQDLDFGSVGTVLVPGTNLAIAGNKAARLYVVDRALLGHYQAQDDSQIVQTIALGGESLFSTPVVYAGAAGARLFAWANQDYLRAFAFDGMRFAQVAQSAGQGTTRFSFAPTLTLSANGDHDALLWALHPVSADGYAGPAALRAFDADDMTSGVIAELWNSDQDASDAVGTFVKFTSPLVAGGKVFVPNLDGQLVVYGLAR
jgi:outer membrane protein assembly factor BamB